jgi:predicted thioesterase
MVLVVRAISGADVDLNIVSRQDRRLVGKGQNTRVRVDDQLAWVAA